MPLWRRCVTYYWLHPVTDVSALAGDRRAPGTHASGATAAAAFRDRRRDARRHGRKGWALSGTAPPGASRRMIQYPIPGAWVREFTVEVPLDWDDPGAGSIRV